MRIAYFECYMGISGDMTLGALIDAGVDAQQIRAGLASLPLPGVTLNVEKVLKGGFSATAVQVLHPPQHAHRHLGDIEKILEQGSALTARQRDLAWQIFLQIAQAEAKVHGSTLDRVHFHEVGAIDSIVDIVGVAIGIDLLNVDQIVCSPIPTGHGLIQIDHGICPVPAPGTAELLKGIPLRDVPVEAELTTPTGAAIVKTLVDRFGPRPEMTIRQIGYGAGTKSFPERANLLRLFVGESTATPDRETLAVLETNLDDVSAEILGYTRTQLEQAGALDVFTTSAQMKKNRPGVLLTVLCRPAQIESLRDIVFAQTGTLGIRTHLVERDVLPRQAGVVETIYGPVTGKLSRPAGQAVWFQPEFEDCARLASEHQVSIREIYRAAQTAHSLTPTTTAAPDHHSDDHHSHDHHSHDHHSHDHHSHDHHSHDHHSHDHHEHDHHEHDHHEHDHHEHDHHEHDHREHDHREHDHHEH